MRHREALRRWRGGVAIAALALLILAAGFCCMSDDDMDHDHAVPMGLCSVVVLMTGDGLVVAGLLLIGLTPALASAGYVTVPLAVPKPPPRLGRISY